MWLVPLLEWVTNSLVVTHCTRQVKSHRCCDDIGVLLPSLHQSVRVRLFLCFHPGRQSWTQVVRRPKVTVNSQNTFLGLFSLADDRGGEKNRLLINCDYDSIITFPKIDKKKKKLFFFEFFFNSNTNWSTPLTGFHYMVHSLEPRYVIPSQGFFTLKLIPSL